MLTILNMRLLSLSARYCKRHLKPLMFRYSSSSIEKDLRTYARKKQTNISLEALMETGKGTFLPSFEKLMSISDCDSLDISDRVQIQVACFLHRELPIRFAQRAQALESVPIMRESKHVSQWYKQSFQKIIECPTPDSLERERYFAKLIEEVYARHSHTLITMAKGAHEIRDLLKHDMVAFALHEEIQSILETFYVSRIGIRTLIGQYLALKNPSPDENVIGLVSQRASPYEIAQEAISDASYMCRRVHGDAPEVTIHGRTDLHFAYIPEHIKYMLVELLKNSMRATAEFHGVDHMPPIRIIIADGEQNEDVVIKVSDEGGGIPRSIMPRIWSYLFTTADPKILDDFVNSPSDDSQDFSTASPLAGLGYGLPIARNYARYFGGDLVVMSMEGYGTDNFIYLSRLGNNREHSLP